MSKTLKRAAGIALAGAAVVGTTVATAPQASAAGEYAGCPYGAVCVYPDGSWNGGHPEHVYWSYGAHNFSNEYGTHRVFNNQSGGATATLNYGSGGSNPSGHTLPAYTVDDYNLTPMNSITLSR